MVDLSSYWLERLLALQFSFTKLRRNSEKRTPSAEKYRRKIKKKHPLTYFVQRLAEVSVNGTKFQFTELFGLRKEKYKNFVGRMKKEKKNRKICCLNCFWL